MILNFRLAPHGVMLLSIALVMFGPAQVRADDGLSLLGEMSAAANQLDYSGEFVYVKDGKISSMKIAHIGATVDSGSQQKLMALDGSMREIIQQDDVVACVLPDQGLGIRETRQSRQLFKFDVSEKLDTVQQFYSVSHPGATRVANRDCQIINIRPNDVYRYGYNLCIDTENHLLLSSELTGYDNTVFESYLFVSVNFNKVAASELLSRTPPKKLKWMDDSHVNTGADRVKSSADDQMKWRVAGNSVGFELEHYIQRFSPALQTEITHLVLGDGLAQVSVFVSPLDASANQSSVALSMGSLNSFTRKADDFMITVVGEVPRETVTLIAEQTESY
jgi:sigma-E factor negative regulatory protein RseB